MKYFLLFVAAITASTAALSADKPLFDDSDADYNPMKYAKTIDTGNGTYTIEFRNDEESYFTNFVVTSTGVVAFDPLSDSAAKEYVKVIKRVAPNKPLLAIVYSHLHTDHISGARILRHHFGQDIPIIAHERTLQHFQRFDVPFVDLPTDTVSDEGKRYQFGNRTIDLHYLGKAHTGSILIPVIPEISFAYVCDYANNDVVGWVDLPGIDISEMVAMQRRTLSLDVDTVSFCHGPPATRKAIERQIEYYQTVYKVAKQARDKGLSEDEAAESIELPQYQHFRNYRDWFEGNIRAMYRWAGRTGAESL